MKKIYYLLIATAIIFTSCAPKSYYLFQSKSKSYNIKPMKEIKPSNLTTSTESETFRDFSEKIPLIEEIPLIVASTNDDIVKESIVQEQNKALESAIKIQKIVESKKEAKESGIKLNRKERKANRKVLKEAKKDFKESLVTVYQESSGKSQMIALLLVALVGVLGVHRFYLGYIGIGVIQLLTLGGCGIWALIDLIRIITGDLKPKDGAYEETL